MVDKIDELLKNQKWKKEKIISRKPVCEEKQKQEETGNVTPQTIEKVMRIKLPNRKGRLGDTGPKPWFDKYNQGGNAKPRNRRREHPSGHHNCG